MSLNRRVFTFFEYGQCPHCQLGWVFFDDLGEWHNNAEPCPMCIWGSMRSRQLMEARQHPGIIKDTATAEYKAGTRSEPLHESLWVNRLGALTNGHPNYYLGVDLMQYTWNRGLTLTHTKVCQTMGCFHPVREGRCSGCVSEFKPPSSLAINRALKLKVEGMTIWDRAQQIDAEEAQRVEAAEYTAFLETANNEAGAA